jgi:type 2 lantibiotic biosynthesis protein LanM
MTDQSCISDGFAPIVRHFTSASCAKLSARLAQVSSTIDTDEAWLIHQATQKALQQNARTKLNRVLLLELHAAKLARQLTAEDDPGQFAQFIQFALTPGFASHLDVRYPPLRRRLERTLDRQCNAIETLLSRFVADRDALASLLGGPSGRLTGLALGQGDLHAGGQSVARLSFENGEVMYKPRSLRIDSVLDAFLVRLFADAPDRIRVPAVIDRGEYGWAAFAPHRYCSDEGELRTFYCGLGNWIAILRLLGGTDIHFENLIAVGPQPIVVDVESLFATIWADAASSYGEAHSVAERLIRNSVLRTGIVPFRVSMLGFSNVDLSAAGALKGEQPKVRVPIIAAEGTTAAHLQIVDADMKSALNHPSPQPKLHRYWDEIASAFLQTTKSLRAMDASGELASFLRAFEGCQVREIRRPTMIYGEVERMLWHPASLHNEAEAIERARNLLVTQAVAVRGEPSSLQDIEGEIDNLRHGDIPIFVETLAYERIEAALADWRSMRVELEDILIRSALVTTQLNQDIVAPPKDGGARHPVQRAQVARLDARRRELAARVVGRLVQLAIRGRDGSATWIAPQYSVDAWHVKPLQPDVYSGLGGVVLALAGYRSEVEHGRADFVPGLEQTLEGGLRVFKAMTDGKKPRTVGGYNGGGGYIWSWLALYDQLRQEQLLANAVACSEILERDGFEADNYLDVMDGCCGTIVPLLALAEATADSRWLALAARAGQRAESFITVDEGGAHWSTVAFPERSGGFLHGAAGIAWSLTRLALAGAGSETDRERWMTLANAVFAFQDSLFDASLGNWDNRRSPPGDSVHTWCNGSVGIGLVAGDLYARTGEQRHLHDLRRAVTATQHAWGITRTLCHGDLSAWELAVRMAAVDPEAAAIDRDALTAPVISALEQRFSRSATMDREAYTPGLMTGLAGVVHSLNRMHPDCTLPSPLLLERRRATASDAALASTERHILVPREPMADC